MIYAEKPSPKPGWRFEIVPLTYDRARLIETDGYSVTRGW